MYYVYVLLSEKNKRKYYVGVTQNLEDRLKRHNQEVEIYSSQYIPWKIETYIAFNDKKLAVNFEKYLKHGSGHAFLKKRFLPEFVH